jgi:hypothetical protein
MEVSLLTVQLKTNFFFCLIIAKTKFQMTTDNENQKLLTQTFLDAVKNQNIGLVRECIAKKVAFSPDWVFQKLFEKILHSLRNYCLPTQRPVTTHCTMHVSTATLRSRVY